MPLAAAVTWIFLLACAGEAEEPDSARPRDSGPGEDSDTDSGGGPDDSDTADSGDSAEVIDGGGACAPGFADVYGAEGRLLTATIGCLGEGTATAFTVDALPDGAAFDGTTVTWTPGLDQAGRYDLVVRATAEDGPSEGEGTVWVADAWWDAGDVPVDPFTYEEEYGLPVLHLTRPPDVNEYDDVPSTLVYRGHSYAIGLQYRGAASLYYPKKSYKLSFDDADQFDDDELGFGKRHALVLTTPFDDTSYLRQKLAFDTWNALRPSRAQLVTAFAVVYMDGAYEGLYLLGDHVDANWWQDQGFTDEGNLYKSVDHSANFYDTYGGAKKWSLHSGYEKKDGEPADDFSDLDAFVLWVVGATDDEFRADLDTWIPREDVYDWWTLCLVGETDDSCGKNAYLYRDVDTTAFRHAPWDFNHSFGQTWQTMYEPATVEEDFTGANNLFARVLDDGDGLGAEMRAALHDAIAGPVSSTEQLARIDGYVGEMWPSAERDWEKWGASSDSYWGWTGDLTTPDEELMIVRNWVVARNKHIEEWQP